MWLKQRKSTEKTHLFTSAVYHLSCVMDRSSETVFWGPNKGKKGGGRKAVKLGWSEETAIVWVSRGEETETKGGGVVEWGALFLYTKWEGKLGKRRRRRQEVIKRRGRREKSQPDMGLYAVLLICLSQAELGRVWAQEHEGKPPFFNVNTQYRSTNNSLLSLTMEGLKCFLALFMACLWIRACVKLTGLVVVLTVSHRKHIKDGVRVWIFIFSLFSWCYSKTSVFPVWRGGNKCLGFICFNNTDPVNENFGF